MNELGSRADARDVERAVIEAAIKVEPQLRAAAGCDCEDCQNIRNLESAIAAFRANASGQHPAEGGLNQTSGEEA